MTSLAPERLVIRLWLTQATDNNRVDWMMAKEMEGCIYLSDSKSVMGKGV